MSSWNCSSCWPGTPGWPSPTRWRSRRWSGSAPMSGRSSTAARTASPCWMRSAWCGSGIRPRTGSPERRRRMPSANHRRSRCLTRARRSPISCRTGAGSTFCAPRWPTAASWSSTSVTSPRPRSSRRPRTCSWPRPAMSSGRPLPWCRDSPAPWPAGGTSSRTPKGAPRCGSSRSGPGRSAGWSSSCCSAREPAPISCRSATARSTSEPCCTGPRPRSGRCRTSTWSWPTSRPACRPPAATPWPPTSSSGSCSRTPSSTPLKAARSPSGPS